MFDTDNYRGLTIFYSSNLINISTLYFHIGNVCKNSELDRVVMRNSHLQVRQ